MAKILFIDDELYHVRDYIAEVTKDHEITHCEDAGDAMSILQDSEEVDGIILDIQMPTPKDTAPVSTGDGVDTGLWLLKEERENLIERTIPILVLTNRRPDLIREKIRVLDFPEMLIDVVQKAHVSCHQVRVKIGAMLRRWGK